MLGVIMGLITRYSNRAVMNQEIIIQKNSNDNQLSKKQIIVTNAVILITFKEHVV